MTRELALAPNACLTVHLSALVQNYREAKRRAEDAVVAPVVKANAYSLGIEKVATALAAEGADTFFVARVQEGIALRSVLPRARIFVLDGASRGAVSPLLAHGLIPVLNTLEEAEAWARHGFVYKRQMPAAVHIDTGMNRLGLSHAELAQNAARLNAALAYLDLQLVMSHLACADELSHSMNRMQLDRFRAALQFFPPVKASFAASAGIELGPDYRFDMVRPGLGLYGGNPVPALANPYRTVAVLTSRVLELRRVDKGESVGYGASFAVSRPSRLATVAIGYADGLMRSNAAGGKAVIGGVRVPFAGRISMDLAVLDVTDVPEQAVFPGAEVEFLGDAVTLEEVAAAAGTNTHEVLTSLSARVTRLYSEA